MTGRKFTPPTVFPTEYVTRDGCKAVVVAWLNNSHLVAIVSCDGAQAVMYFDPCGAYLPNSDNPFDLHDLPKRIVTWHNVYADRFSSGYGSCIIADGNATPDRLCVYRIERDEDGGNPTITVEPN